MTMMIFECSQEGTYKRGDEIVSYKIWLQSPRLSALPDMWRKAYNEAVAQGWQPGSAPASVSMIADRDALTENDFRLLSHIF